MQALIGFLVYDYQFVSIRTRPFGRVMRDGDGGFCGGLQVSIRTRPFGRVMPAGDQAVLAGAVVSIRTRPFGRVMQDQRPCHVPAAKMFQSAPGLSAG